MKERFELSNRPQLIAALKRQEFVCGDDEVARELDTRGSLVEFQPNQNIVLQGGSDNDVYFLIAGVVAIIVNGAQIATRKAGQHIGEMAALEPSLPRSATALVLEQTVALKLSSVSFIEVIRKFPQVLLPVSSPSYSAGLEFELTGVAQGVELA
jgi:CRP/FNR family transcriptional regulator, cyclic AMP receptor protein